MIRHAWLLAVLVAGPGVPASAQLSAFRYDPARVPVGRLSEYVKSNRDLTHPARVSVYVAGPDRIESLKWEPGETTATLVVALMDWSRMSVRRFESWQLRRGEPDVLRATLDVDSSGAHASFAPGRVVPVGGWPWHSYDFDFTSLGLTLPHLARPEGEFVFRRLDVVVVGDEPSFADLGDVSMRFERRERRGGRETRRWRIGGPGLQDSTGVLWSDLERGNIVELELPVPDEPGFVDGRLRLEEIREVSAAEWQRLKRARVGE